MLFTVYEIRQKCYNRNSLIVHLLDYILMRYEVGLQSL